MRSPVRVLFFAALTLAFSPTVPADAKNADAPKKWSAGGLAEARKRLFAGNFEEAREAFQEATKKDAKLAPLAAIGTAQTFREVGEFEKALDALNSAVKATPENPDVLAARADLLYELGRWDDAEKDADAAIARKENQLRARWTKARVLRERGNLDDADKAFRWVVRHYTARSNADDDITDPDELLLVALAGAENARWHSLSKQFSFILNEVIGDALKADPDLWPAEFVAGSMLLEKYNRPDAGDAFDKALKINPKAADALVGKGQSAFIKYEFTDAESFADQALKVNPKHPSALRLKADVQIMGGDFPAAEKLLTTAKGVNPRDSHTLGRLAAIYLLQHRDKEFDAVVKEVEGFDAKPGVFYYELGHALEERKRYADAEKYLRKAADLRPMLAGPRNGLGLLQLRMGDEKGARTSLDKAFETDPFNVRVSNSIKVLKHLDKYETITTPHYELRFDPNTDKLLAKFVADYLEETHVELKRQFGYEPPNRVLIEVFSTHEMFSGRTVGLPDLHTIGACTGKVIAMASPTAKGLRKPFNWGRVIRHELTHIFNLAQTDYLCPHWLTEGLAVRNEQMARPPQWVQVLRERANANTLLDLDTITLGFVRPRSPDEWQLAYCQSQIYVEYMVKNHGEESVGKVLDQYKTGVDDATVLKRALGVEKAAFEKGYKEYVAEVLKGYRSGKKQTPEKAMTFEELVEAQKKEPDDADLAARLAEQYFRRMKANDARKLADAALKAKPGHAVATVVKARLLQRGGDDDGAKELLQAALKDNPDDHRLLMAVAKFHLDAKDYEAAAKLLEHGRTVAPLDGDWLEQLARVYKETKDAEKLMSVLAEVVSHDPDELDGRVRLAKAALEAKKYADAERFALDAIHIEVANADAKAVLLDALKAQKKDAEAAKLEKRYGE